MYEYYSSNRDKQKKIFYSIFSSAMCKSVDVEHEIISTTAKIITKK